MQPPKKPKKQKQKLSDKYKQHCQQQLRKDPPIYLISSLRQKTLALDIDLLQADDIAFFAILLKLPITKIYLFCQEGKKLQGPNANPIYGSYRFKDVLREIAEAMLSLESLRSVIFERVPLTTKSLLILKQSIGSSTTIKQLSLKSCQLTDQHLQTIKSSIARNESLVILDLSHNKLCNAGGMIGKIMSEHSSRRDQLVWFASLRDQTLEDDLSKRGICEVNLQGNQLNDKAVGQLIQFLRADQWSRCLNLRSNKLGVDAVREFARLIKKNSTLISLDLRGNPGFTKQYSVYILKKLKQNIQKYRQQKKMYQKNKRNKQSKTLQNMQNNNQHKSLQQIRRQSLYKKTQSIGLQFTMNNNNNVTSIPKSRRNIGSKSQLNCEQNICRKCREKTLQMLKLEKRNLDLQIQIKKLKRILLTKNIDLSAILPHQNHTLIQNSQTHQQFSRALHLVNMNANSENDQDLINRVEQIMMELTKIMDNIDAQQNTQIINVSNNISHAHSLSNTIPLFANPSQLESLEQLEQSSIRGKVETQRKLEKLNQSQKII